MLRRWGLHPVRVRARGTDCRCGSKKGWQLLETGMEIGGRVLSTAKEEAREQGFTGQKPAETINEIADRGTKVAEMAKTEAVQAVRDSGGSKSEPVTYAG